MMLLLDNVEVGHGGQKNHVERFLIVIKNILIILLMYLFITFYFGKNIENQLLIDKYLTIILPAEGSYEKNISIPLLKKEIHITESSDNSFCKQSIAQKSIFNELYHNNDFVDLSAVNNLASGSKITYKIFNSTKRKCKVNIHIIDPYGNMLKIFLFKILPTILIFYFLIKIFFRKLNGKKIKRYGDNDNPKI